MWYGRYPKEWNLLRNSEDSDKYSKIEGENGKPEGRSIKAESKQEKGKWWKKKKGKKNQPLRPKCTGVVMFLRAAKFSDSCACYVKYSVHALDFGINWLIDWRFKFNMLIITMFWVLRNLCMSNFIKNLRIFYTIEIPIVSEKIAYYRWYHRIGKKSPIAHPWCG